MNKEQAKSANKKGFKKRLKIFLVLIFLLAFIGVGMNLIGLSAAKNIAYENIKPVASERARMGKRPVEVRKLTGEENWTIFADKYTSTVKENGNKVDNYLKVIQLTDLHFGGGFISLSKDSMAINAIKNMVEWAQPDLIIVTGDALFPMPQSGSINNGKTFDIVATTLDSFKIPWAFVFGNHDSESFSTLTKKQISNKLLERSYNPKEGTYCLYQEGQDFGGSGTETPIGNYQVTVRDRSTNQIVHSLFFMDSNRYFNPKGERFSFFSYDKIHDNQVEWYASEVELLKSRNGGTIVPSSLFIHIPLPEYKLSWINLIGENERNRDDHKISINEASEVKYFGGDMQDVMFGSKDVIIACANEKIPDYNNMYEKIVELNSTSFVYCGHNHENNLSVETKEGVRLTHSKSIDYLGYPGISKRTFARGCTLIYLTGKTNQDAHVVYQKKLINVYVGDDLESQPAKYKKIIDLNTEKSIIDDVKND